MAKKKKKAKKKAVKKKTTKKKIIKKKTTKKKAKKKAIKKKTTKKKAKKKAVKKKTTKKKAKKKAVKKKTTKKKVKKKNVAKKEVKKAPNLKVYKAKVTVGESVPEFRLLATGEQTVSLSGLNGQKVVIFFYPKDSTPGCTIEAHDFTRLKPEFAKENTVVYGVSRDSIRSHERFKEKQSYTIDLLSDEKEELCAIFGAIRLKNMYGKQVRGIDRSTFVIDENGKLEKEWRTVKVTGHADEVLDYIKKV